MTYTLAIAEAAEKDIRQAFLWYEEQQPTLGSTFEKHILKAMESKNENPLKIQTRYKNIRVFFLTKKRF